MAIAIQKFFPDQSDILELPISPMDRFNRTLRHQGPIHAALELRRSIKGGDVSAVWPHLEGCLDNGNIKLFLSNALNLPVNLEPIGDLQVKSYSGPDTDVWKGLQMNSEKLLQAYRSTYGNSEWNEGVRVKESYSRFIKGIAVLKRLRMSYQHNQFEFHRILSNLEADEREMLRAIYFESTETTPIIKQVFRLHPTAVLLIANPINENMGYQSFIQMVSRLPDNAGKAMQDIFEEYYPIPELETRLEAELANSNSRVPILIVAEQEIQEYGEVIAGFCWAMFYTSPHAYDEIARRVTTANYTQTEQLINGQTDEQLRISESLRDYALSQGSEELVPICYIDEVAIIPEMQGRGVFKSLFSKLIESLAEQADKQCTQNNKQISIFCFRTKAGGKMDSITDRIFGASMRTICSSEGVVYKAISIPHQLAKYIASSPEEAFRLFTKEV